MVRNSVVMLTLAGHLLATYAASAKEPDDVAEAKRLYQEAERHFSLGDFDLALESYKEAYSHKNLPGFLFNIGQCYYNLGRYRRAVFFYQRYLTRLPDAPNHEQVEQLIARARAKLSRPTQRTEPASQPSTQHEKPLNKPKQTPQSQPTPHETLERPPNGTLTGRSEPGDSAPRDSAPRDSEPRDSEPRGNQSRAILLWTGLGVGAALLVAGTVTGAMVLQKRSEYESPQTPRARQLDLASSGGSLRTVSTITFALGGAVVGGAALYYWLTRQQSRSSTIAAAPVPGGAMVQVETGF